MIDTPDEKQRIEPEDESLCAYCANREECSGHHMMCIDYQPAEKKEDSEAGN